MTTKEAIDNMDIRHIVDEGTKIYEQVKSQYETKDKGKFLAIEVDSKNVYFGITSIEAVMLAKGKHPDKRFFLVKIGFDSVETMALEILKK